MPKSKTRRKNVSIDLMLLFRSPSDKVQEEMQVGVNIKIK